MGQEFSGEARGDFRCAVGFSSRWTNVLCEDSKWNAADLHSGIFTGCTFKNCDFTQALFSACLFTDCVFTDCVLDIARFDSSKFEKVRFEGGRAEYASFWNATLDDVDFDLALHGADLRWKHAKDVDMGESNLWGVSVNISCAQFRHVAYSKRQLELLAALMTSARGEPSLDLRAGIRDIIGDDAFRMMDRLTLAEDT